MGVGSHRNKPCYCGSEKKFKKCHLPIVLEYHNTRNPKLIPELPWELQNEIRFELDKSRLMAEKKIPLDK